MDNCSGHKLTDDVVASLDRVITELFFLPSNSTHLCQPLDAFIIQNIKEVWRRHWNQEKIRRILNGEWADGVTRSRNMRSGKLRNPGKSYYSKLAAQCVKEVNEMVDENGLSLVRKAMIRCGMSLNTNGKWEKCQLFDHLQDIIRRHPDEFNGTEPTVET